MNVFLWDLQRKDQQDKQHYIRHLKTNTNSRLLRNPAIPHPVLISRYCRGFSGGEYALIFYITFA